MCERKEGKAGTRENLMKEHEEGEEIDFRQGKSVTKKPNKEKRKGGIRNRPSPRPIFGPGYKWGYQKRT